MSEEKKYVRIIDTSATIEAPVRQHEQVVNGIIKKYEFKYGEELVLPFEEGMKFMRPGFIVSEGGVVIDRPSETVDAVRFQIGEDEVVARYSELTLESLKLRAVSIPGGEKFITDDSVDRATLINFIKSFYNLAETSDDETVDNLADLLEEGDDTDETPPPALPVPDAPLMPVTTETEPTAREVVLTVTADGSEVIATPAENAGGIQFDPES